MVHPRSDRMIIALITLFFVCLILSGFFSATETAFTSINRLRIKTKAEDGDKKAKSILHLIDRYDNLLSTILIGNNIVNILMSSVATILFVQWVGGAWGPTASTAVTTVLVLICGEITPKTLAKEYPETFAGFVAPIIHALMVVFTPFNLLFGGWKLLLGKIFKNKEDTSITDDELLTIVDEAEQEGGINAQEKELIKSAIEFNDLEVKDILIPRIDVIVLEDTADKNEISAVFSETGYSRIPIYQETVDNIVGILHEKDFINHKEDDDFTIAKWMKPAVFVVPTTKISDGLKLLQKNKTHMAIVSGEFGDTLGIITMEDILEELVGEIWDEHDDVITNICEVDDNTYIVNGGLSVTDFNDYFEMEIETDSTTVGGWVVSLLEKVPEEGNIATYENFEFLVTQTDTRRITELKVTVHPVEEEE